MQALLGFLPNGLGLMYDKGLKSLPGIGPYFARKRVDKVMKLFLGISLWQGLAGDLARVFWPLGYGVGAVLGSLISLRSTQKPPVYAGTFGRMLFKFSGHTLSGALGGMIFFEVIRQVFNFSVSLPFSVLALLAASVGAALVIGAKLMLLFAVNAVTASNAAMLRKNVMRSKTLNSQLQEAAKQKVKSRILIHAQDIIQQMNGAQSQAFLEEFLQTQYDAIAVSMNKTIERHFNYLCMRACYGDLAAFKRLQELSPSRYPAAPGGKNAFEIMLDRIFNARAIFKLRDDVDTAYDRWQYRDLRKREGSPHPA